MLYRRPRPYLFEEDWCRFHHEDLACLDDLELSRELSRLWRRITIEWPPKADWLWQRRAACFAERDRRRMGRAA